MLYEFWENSIGDFSLCVPHTQFAYGKKIWEFDGAWEDAVQKKDDWFDKGGAMLTNERCVCKACGDYLIYENEKWVHKDPVRHFPMPEIVRQESLVTFLEKNIIDPMCHRLLSLYKIKAQEPNFNYTEWAETCVKELFKAYSQLLKNLDLNSNNKLFREIKNDC